MSILGFARARCCMILLARNWSRRCSRCTLEAYLVRKSASSIAVSPPPTTATSLPRKKKPSQVAQPLTPLLVGQPQPLGAGAGGDDDRLAEVSRFIGGPDLERSLREIHTHRVQADHL